MMFDRTTYPDPELLAAQPFVSTDALAALSALLSLALKDRTPSAALLSGASRASHDQNRGETDVTRDGNAMERIPIQSTIAAAAAHGSVRLGCIRVYWPFHFKILLKQKSFPRGNVFKPRGVNMCSWSDSPQNKAGGSNDQISAQVCDAGNVTDGADRCAIIHSSFCDGRRRWWRWRWWSRWRRWRRYIPFFLAAPGRAFVVP
jgi:hypothetical protein